MSVALAEQAAPIRPIAENTPPILRIRDLRVAFGEAAVVDAVGFDVAPGEALGIVGESGSGKSMTCRAVLGLLPSAARVTGSVRLEASELLDDDVDWLQVRGRRISMVFQDPSSHLDPLMRVGDQVAEALVRHRDATRSEARREAVRLLGEMRIPEPERWARAYPHQLSGGMKQRVMIAAALACDPDVLLADEPTTALDVTVQKEILDLLARLRRERGLAVVFVSHDLGAVASVCERMLVMRAGQIVEAGETGRLVRAPEHDYTRALVAAHPDRLVPGPLVSREDAAGWRLRATNLSVRYGRRSVLDIVRGRAGGFEAVRGVDLAVRPGEAVGIVGESGSGKSSVARALVGLVAPSAGTLTYDGAPAAPAGRDRVGYLRRVQLVYQHPAEALSPRLTARDAIAEPLRRHRLCPPGQVPERVGALMAQVELGPELAARRPAELSGGQCQRVAVARALALDPQVLIADEVTSALDVTVQAQVLDLLARLQRERGLALIFISHDLGVVRHLCDRVIVMRRGVVVEAGATAEVFDTPREAYTRALIDAIPRLSRADDGVA